jgi:FkbM family methyltransferase
MNIIRVLRRNPKAVLRFLLWRVGIKRYQTIIPIFLIKKHVPKDPVVLEAGAHDGGDTVQLVQNLRPRKLYAFEPVPELFKRLEEKLHPFREVECFPLALAHRRGQMTMYVSNGSVRTRKHSIIAADASSSLLKPTGHLNAYPTIQYKKQIKVPVTTIDDFARQHDIKRIDFMWLDMQGAELMALQGSERLLDRVSSVYLEVSTVELYADAPTYHEVKEWMVSRGFTPRYEAVPTGGHGNVLFVRTNEGASSAETHSI